MTALPEIAAQMDLVIQPYDWIAKDRDGCCCVRIWGHNRDSERVLLRIEDYQPFCRIQLPSFVNGQQVEWNQAALKEYAEWIRRALKDDAPTNIQGGYMPKLYFYEGDKKYPFIICYFSTKNALNHCTRMIGKRGYDIQNLGFIKARVCESSITIIHKMVTQQKLKYGAWFRASVQQVEPIDQISRNKLEYICSFKDLHDIPMTESQGWITNPKIGSYDLECNSQRIRSFPNMNYVSDAVFMISYISQRDHDHASRKKYLLVVGKCEPIEGAEIRYFNHEIEAIHGLMNLIVEDDPSILIGYNTARFDIPYMDARMKLFFQDWRYCGLLIAPTKTGVKTKEWQSGAYGHVSISSFRSEGRLNIDMYTIIKRDHKLDLYNLDFVSNKFLGRGKHPVKPEEMFRIYQGSVKVEKELVVVNRDLNQSQTTVEQYQLVPADYVLQIAEWQRSIHKLQKKLQKLLDEQKYWAEEMARVGKYCLEDSCLPIELFEETYTWIDLLETSSIVQVTVTQIFSRGQQIRVYNQIYSYAYHMGIVMDQRDNVREKTVGGNVAPPKVGLWFYILLLDFASLYPSIIRAFNLCYTTLVPLESNIPDEMCHVIAWTDTDADGTVIYHRHRFIKAQYRKGILPQMCENLTNARSEVRDQISPQNPPIVNIILNKRQLNLKGTNNSVFGYTGAQKQPIQEVFESITACGRELIRKSSDYVENVRHGQVVYGDTDSDMVSLGLNDPYTADDANRQLSKELTALFPPPLKMEPETVFIVGLFVKKKMYMAVPIFKIKVDPSKGDTVEEVLFKEEHQIEDYRLYKVTTTRDDKTTVKFVGIPSHVDITTKDNWVKGMPLLEGGAPDPSALIKKGMMSARRDNAVWARQTHLKITLKIMFKKSLQHTLQTIDDEILMMMTRQVPFKGMVATQGIGTNYKPNSKYPMKLFSDELRLAGRPVEPGERIDYVYVVSSDPIKNTKMGYKMRTPDMYWENYQEEPIDYICYINKIGNALEQLLYVGYKNQIDEIERRCRPDIRRRGKIYTYISSKYIKIWVKMLQYKAALVKTIKTRLPHFPSQEPYYSSSFIEIIDEPLPLENSKDDTTTSTGSEEDLPDYLPDLDEYGAENESDEDPAEE